jgi:hypothetical protein
MVMVKEFARIRIKEDGKIICEVRSGDDLWRKMDKWMKLRRLVDWKGNWYRETITDPHTGVIVRYCDEPLDLHQGHGSAKKLSARS